MRKGPALVLLGVLLLKPEGAPTRRWAPPCPQGPASPAPDLKRIAHLLHR